MKKVFLTGGSGFIGSKLNQKLSQAGYEVYAPEFDLLNSEETTSHFDKGNWDFVIHLAGISSHKECNANPALCYQINVSGTALLAYLAKETNANFVFASTGQVYDTSSSDGKPLTEKTPTVHQNVYASSKLMAEECLQSICSSSSLSAVVLRLFNHTHMSQSTDFFLPYVYSELQQGKQSIQVGNIDLSRDFSSIHDLMDLFVALLKTLEQKPTKFEIFNVCSGVAKNLRELVTILSQRLEKPAEFEVDPSRVRKNEILNLYGSINKIKAFTGWEPQYATSEKLIESFLTEI